jgi:hypothetical protein
MPYVCCCVEIAGRRLFFDVGFGKLALTYALLLTAPDQTGDAASDQ